MTKLSQLSMRLRKFEPLGFPTFSILIGIEILTIHGYSLLRFPPPFVDEAWRASEAWGFIQSGSWFGPLNRGVLDLIPGYERFYPWLPTAIQSLGVRLFGVPDLLAMRFTSLAMGMLLLLAVFSLGNGLAGRQMGLLGLVFTAHSFPFFLSAHLGRMDVIAAAFGYAGLALYANNRPAKIWRSALAGLVAALAFEAHPHAAIFALTLLALCGLHYRWSLFRKPDFWGFAAGGLVGLLIYLYIHVLPNPQAFLTLNRLVYFQTHAPPLLTFDLSVIWPVFSDMLLFIAKTYPQAIIALWAVVRLTKSGPPYWKALLVMNIALLLGFALFVRNKFLLYYAILFTPALSLLAAAYFDELLKSPARSKYETRARQLIVAAFALLPVLPLLRYNSSPYYQQLQAQVNQAVRPNDVIMGNQLYWFGLKDHKYSSWENLVYYRRYRPESSLEDAFRFLKPDIFIFDSQVGNFVFDGERENLYLQNLQISATELESFLDRYATLEKTLIEEDGKPLRIYRINWSD